MSLHSSGVNLAASSRNSLLFLILIASKNDAIFSPFGTGFIYAASTARINYAMAKIDFFPEYFKKLTRHGVPMRAVVFNYFVGLLMFLPFPGWRVSKLFHCILIWRQKPVFAPKKFISTSPQVFLLPCPRVLRANAT